MTVTLTYNGKMYPLNRWTGVPEMITRYTSPTLKGLYINRRNPGYWEIVNALTDKPITAGRTRQEAARAAEFLVQHHNWTIPIDPNDEDATWDLADLACRAWRVGRGRPDPGEWSDEIWGRQ